MGTTSRNLVIIMSIMTNILSVQAAAERLRGHIHRSPLMSSTYFDELVGAELVFKCENFQKIGAFKIRGATNFIRYNLGEKLARGVITHSSGNHGQAVALAAKMNGIPATVVMPLNTSSVKIAAVESYGGQIVFCKPSTQARDEAVAAIVAKSGLTFIHPFNDELVIAGQGTAAKELIEERQDLDAIVVPVGGGGLLSGTCLAVAEQGRRIAVLGAEPELANDATQSLAAHKIVSLPSPVTTIADGLRANAIGPRNFAIIEKNVSRIWTVSDQEIIRTMLLVWERMKIVIEPSSAVPLAAVIRNRHQFHGQRVGIILTGGNVALDQLPWGKLPLEYTESTK